MLISLITHDKEILSHVRLPDPTPSDGLPIVIHQYGKSLTLCGVKNGRLQTEAYLSVPFGKISNKNTFKTVKNYYKRNRRDGYVKTEDRKILQAVGWVFTNSVRK